MSLVSVVVLALVVLGAGSVLFLVFRQQGRLLLRILSPRRAATLRRRGGSRRAPPATRSVRQEGAAARVVGSLPGHAGAAAGLRW